MKYKTREEWLLAAIDCLKPRFKSCGYTIPKKVKVSCGWPFGTRGKVTGECWSSIASKGKNIEIFITPAYDDSEAATKEGILSTLIHELIHATVGNKCGHKGPFKQAFKKLGLTGKVKESVASPELCEVLESVAKKLGPFPHKALKFKGRPKKKQTTRLLKVGCPKCDYIVRVTRIHLEEKGAPLCPIHKVAFKEIDNE